MEEKMKKEKGIVKVKNSIVSAIDENGNGEIDVEDVVIKGLKIPGIRIKRDDFLQKSLFKKYPQETIDIAITENPMKANIPVEEIDKIAEDVIKFERNCVSGISTALGIPGGVAMVATIPADIAQYYGYLLRATQKLLYLYGFLEIDTTENGGKFDDGTMNTLIICFGIMYGTLGANNAIKAMAKALGTGVEKKLLKKALTKGVFFPLVKSVASWFGVNITKKVFAGFFKNAIPVAGGIIGGGITYIAFKPCCDKLKNSLRDTILSNPDYKPAFDEEKIYKDIVEDVEE
ncbi:MAG: hypothetical protein IJZ04_06550 [Clostridia bacterium]|nr:hypothetical protein [Clostridia bacterium]